VLADAELRGGRGAGRRGSRLLRPGYAGDLGKFLSLTGAVRLMKLPAKQSKRLTISGTLESASEPRLMLF
jgi:hypothetical protein